MKIKKFVVSISFGDFKAKSEEFVIPFTNNESDGFRGIKSGEVSKFGMVVFIGKEISANDVFAKLVDSGQKINDVDGTLAVIERYLEEIQQFKIGNVIRVSYKDGINFELIKEANGLPRKKKKLP